MADKPHSNDHSSSWLDGFPHDFNGWGPKTPDPELPQADVILLPDDRLSWSGEDHGSNLHVWRFDGRRRSHH
jgi:hypothetical protein